MKSSKNSYKRKDKSLEELSHRFLSVLALEKEGFVYLDEMTI